MNDINKTKQAACDLAWKLFSGYSRGNPFYIKKFESCQSDKDDCGYPIKWVPTHNFAPDIDEFTMLTKILPRTICLGELPFFGKSIPKEYKISTIGLFTFNYIHVPNDESLFVYHEKDDEDEELETDATPAGDTDFWQAVLNLLTAIQDHPDKDKMIFKWSEV